MAGVTLVSDESAKTVAATHPRVREVDQVQYANNGGPCLTASRDGRSVVVDVDQVRSRWPALEASAADLGIKSFIALPLMLSDRIHGSFNLYSSDPRGFQSLDESLLELFTTAAVTALQQAERHRRALASIPMKRLGTPDDVAAAIAFFLSDEAGFRKASPTALVKAKSRSQSPVFRSS